MLPNDKIIMYNNNMYYGNAIHNIVTNNGTTIIPYVLKFSKTWQPTDEVTQIDVGFNFANFSQYYIYCHHVYNRNTSTGTHQIGFTAGSYIHMNTEINVIKVQYISYCGIFKCINNTTMACTTPVTSCGFLNGNLSSTLYVSNSLYSLTTQSTIQIYAI